MKLKSVGEQTVETDAAQIINVGSTQSITAAAHSTFNNNLTITGTTHSVGDVSTDAGNAPTLATHKHKQTGGTAPDGDGPNNKQTSVADEA
jgi:hypothetical protein